MPKTKPQTSKSYVEVEFGDWLGLDEAEKKVVDFRVALVKAIRRIREVSNETQADLAKRAGTKQPNIAKIEAGGIGVSLDVLLRVYFTLGVNLKDLGICRISNPTRPALGQPPLPEHSGPTVLATAGLFL